MSFGGGFMQKPFGGVGDEQDDVPKTTVELSVSCSGLKDKDLLSKSDPVCALYMNRRTAAGTSDEQQWDEFGRTEEQRNTQSPQWIKKFICEYRFEEKQMLKFLVVDKDSESAAISSHDLLGSLECSLGEVVAAQSRGFNKPLNQGSGYIRIEAQELSASNELIHLSISAKGLDNKDTFGKSDPYLQIYRVRNGSASTAVHKTETINNNLNPTWKPFSIESRLLCNNDEDLPLQFSVYDFDNDGDHDLIGSFQATLNQIYESSSPQFPLINEKKRDKKGKKYENSGVLVLNSIKREKQISFLDYIQGGLQVNFTIGIDFTGSNGNPKDSSSLHYMSPDGVDNQYSVAIKAVGEVIQDYDSDRMFPCLGFGAKIPPNGDVSHEFFLTLDTKNPFCSGIPGVMSAYKRCLSNIRLYGPTNFSPVIEHVARFARAHNGEASNYFVLLIITDGIITDMEETKRSIVAASTLPMSIIIVGVGNEDFSAMEVLDGDKMGLMADGQSAQRDIVQFVELRKFVEGDMWNKETLAKAVLSEIPKQVLSYMDKNGLQPGVRK